MSLTDTAIRNAKPGVTPQAQITNKSYRMYDTGGLYIEVSPSGGKWWRLKFRVDGKEKRLSLGTYPEVGLKDARRKRDDLRKQLADGIDPGEHRKAVKISRTEMAANSFEVVAREWFGKFSPTWAKGHADKLIRRLERDVFPWVGKKPVNSIKPPEVLAVLQRIESRGAIETAHRAKQNMGQVFRYAIQTGRAESDPTQPLKGALTPVNHKHFPTLTDPKDIGALLRAIEDFSGSHIVKAALKLAPHVFLRPGELRMAEWKDFDLKAGLWTVPASARKLKNAEKQKSSNDHLVPLSTQAIAILKEIQPISGDKQFVFPGRNGGIPISNNTLNAALARMGYKETIKVHGFRAMARTILDERLGFPPDWIEHQLAHAVRDPLGRAYNRTTHLDGRKKMMQGWADYLDSLKNEAKGSPQFSNNVFKLSKSIQKGNHG